MVNLGVAWRGALLGACCALLMSCGGSNNGRNFVPTTGFVRIVNSISDSPTLQTGVTSAVLASVSFAQTSTLTPLNAGRYALNVQYLNGAGLPVSVISNEVVTVQADEQVSVFLVGTMNSPSTKIVINPIPEIAPGSAEFQVVHTANSVGTVDVYLTAAGASLAGATPLNLAYEMASDLSTIESGNYQIRVTAPGSATVLYDSGAFAIASKARAAFVLVDYFGPAGNGFRVVQLLNVAASTLPAEVLPGALRAANMIGNQTQIDVAVDGAVAFSAAAFATVSARQQFAAGDHSITVTPAGVAAPVLLSGTVNLNPGESRTLVFANSSAGVVGRFSRDDTRPISVQPQLQVVQASPSSGNIDGYLLAPTEAVDTTSPELVDLPLLSLSSITPTADSYDVVFTPTGDTTIAAGPEPVVLDDAGIYSIYVSDAPGGGLPIQIVLGDDFIN